MNLLKFYNKVSKISSASQNADQSEFPSHSSLRQEIDTIAPQSDPAERTPILEYHPNHRDEIRRAYIQGGACQPRYHDFPQSHFSEFMRLFNPLWFDEFNWLEYSVSTDAAYYLPCYLFKGESIQQDGGDIFSSKGFRNWNKKECFKKRVGLPNSIHNKANRNCDDLMQQKQSIIAAFDKQSDQTKREYWLRLNASVDVVRILLTQGFAFRGHDESETSLNKGNFIEILSWYAAKCDKIEPFVLKHAPKNNKMTSSDIQKEIVTACKIETIKAIIEDLNGDYFTLLVDESLDVSRKEQMAIVLRYVDKKGSVMERFIGMVYVRDTSALSLKKAIVDVLVHHSLSLSSIRGQCYDGASNMQGDIKGLKKLIKQESRSAHSIHCFAHQLQLTLVAVSKKCVQVGELVLLVSNILNVLGASFKRVDEFRGSQKEKLQEALDMGELKIGKGLNQELGLVRAGDTRWGSHYKSFENFIRMFGSIVDVLDTLVEDAGTLDDRAKASGYLEACQTYKITAKTCVFCKVLDWQVQELNDHFDEVTTELLHGFACLNPIDAFSSFDIRKIMKMAEFYPDDFDEFRMNALENQLASYIIDVRDFDERFSNLNGF
ncbi:PREDICTED: zinc finger MYM-type protein 1-like [Nicotiana attenuata]|uniref:zinc finger MYM-type protein 1-like n=1 Tax=Nicotiana attenuata TaxID=49451 RepID=UPI0009056263|nr:PREDICTED: zinc finger MYM-type protein 1-like [Nicotiana attenuata]